MSGLTFDPAVRLEVSPQQLEDMVERVAAGTADLEPDSDPADRGLSFLVMHLDALLRTRAAPGVVITVESRAFRATPNVVQGAVAVDPDETYAWFTAP